MSAVAAPRAPIAVYMLADHLDAALAAGEDLMARGLDWRVAAECAVEDETAFALNQRHIAEDVRGLELMLIARVLKAREHARTLGAIDARFKGVAELFASGTAALLDAVDDCDDTRSEDFDTGDGLTAYVRSRGLISPVAARILTPAELSIDDSFLVARRAALGPLMDMAAAFLDALETHYDVFLEDEDSRQAERRAPARDRDFTDRRDRISLN